MNVVKYQIIVSESIPIGSPEDLNSLGFVVGLIVKISSVVVS